MIIIFGPDGNPIYRGSSAQYNGDKFGGQNTNWVTFSPDANDFITYTYGELSKRGATLYHTSAIARACVNKPLTYAIGDGLFFRSAINADFLGLDPDEAKEWSRRFSELLNLEKIHANYYEKQGLLYREAAITGDSVLYFLYEAEKPEPFDPIVTGGYDINWKAPGTILGIKTDSYNRRLGFVRSNGREVSYTDDDGNQNAVQFMFKERAGQLRGMCRYYSEIGRSKSFDRMWDATVERMVQEAVQVGYYKSTTSDPSLQGHRAALEAKGIPARSGDLEDASGVKHLTPGNMYIMRNNEEMGFNDMKAPSNNFDMGNEWTVNMFGMATGWSPEFLMGKYPTSFTAHKGALNDVIKRIKQERTTFTRTVDTKVNMQYLKHFARTGQIDVPAKFWTDYKVQQAYLTGSYLGPVPGHINPYQEIKADLEAVNMGANSLEAVASKFGIDFWPMVDEMQAQQDKWDRLDPAAQTEQLINDDEARDEDGNLTENTADKNVKKKRFFIFGRNK